MKKQLALLALAALLLSSVCDENTAWARGFGGGRLGGRLGGGGFGGRLGGGGFSGGGFSGGNFANRFGGGQLANRFGGGQLGNRLQSGNFGNRLGSGQLQNRLGGGDVRNRLQNSGLLNGSGLSGLRQDFNNRPTRSSLNNFLGLPSDAGKNAVTSSHPMGDNFNVNTKTWTGPRGGQAAGGSVTGPRGNTYAAGGARGPNGGIAAGEGVRGNRGTVAGRGGVVGPNGRAAGGGAIVGPNGGFAARGGVVGPRGAAGGFVYHSPSGNYVAAGRIRTNWNNYNIYTRGWYTNHPGAWFAAGWVTGSAWTYATYPVLYPWFGYASYVQPIEYNYGSNVVYNNGDVYVNNQNVGTSQQYYQQAQQLSDTGAQAQPADDTKWMALGVFAVSEAGQDTPVASLQLAVDKDGVLRGNYTDDNTNAVQQVQGSVDKQSQKVAFTIGDNKDTVVEVGLYNLTKDQTTALVHEGADNTEQWLLVRLNQGSQDGSQTGDQSQSGETQSGE